MLRQLFKVIEVKTTPYERYVILGEVWTLRVKNVFFPFFKQNLGITNKEKIIEPYLKKKIDTPEQVKQPKLLRDDGGSSMVQAVAAISVSGRSRKCGRRKRLFRVQGILNSSCSCQIHDIYCLSLHNS